MNSFIVVGRSRTGTNLLLSFLNKHPKIECEGEILNRKTNLTSLETAKQYWNSGDFRGFKAFYYHPDNRVRDKIWNYIKDNDIKVIHIVRENILRTIVSSLIASKNHHYRLKDKNDKLSLNKKKVKLDLSKLRWKIYRIKYWVNLFRDKFPNAFEIEYNDIKTKYKQAEEFLGVEPKEAKTSMIRQNPEPLSELIINYKEVIQFLNEHNIYYNNL